MNKDALTAPEVAEILKVAQNTVYELVKRGELNCYKIGRKMRFTYDDVQEYIERSRYTARGLAEKRSAKQVYSGQAEKQTGERFYSGQEEKQTGERFYREQEEKQTEEQVYSGRAEIHTEMQARDRQTDKHTEAQVHDRQTDKYTGAQVYDRQTEKLSVEKVYPGHREVKQRMVSFATGGTQQKHAVFKLCGHDEILDVLAKYMSIQSPDIRIERLHKGSYDSLVALYKDEVIVAASHMWDARTDSYNYPYLTKMLPGCPVVAVRVAERSEGFYVASGNPKNITSWEDLRRNDLIIANREPGAGTRILLDEHLQMLGIPGNSLKGYDSAHLSHMSVAGSISKGEADFGIGTEKTALNMRGVDYVPLQMEHYDLIFKKENIQDERIQLMLRILQSEEFREQFIYMNGYDVSEMGKVAEPDAV